MKLPNSLMSDAADCDPPSGASGVSAYCPGGDVCAGTIPNVVSSPTTVQISATYGLVTVTRTLTVVPTALRQLYLTPTTVIGGCGSSSGRIVLTGSAPSGGAVVTLTNTNAKANVPANVTVPTGTTSANFSVSTCR
jgi:hypothetical protein